MPAMMRAQCSFCCQDGSSIISGRAWFGNAASEMMRDLQRLRNSQCRSKPSRPLYVQVHPDNNVAIVVNEGGLRAGARFDSGLVLTEDIPEAHKVALTDILAGAPIVRYGSVIGFAERDIVKGSWVHEGKMRLPGAPALDDLPLATKVPAPVPPLEGYTFQGFVNDDGTVGTKNILGITTTVQW